MVVVAPYTQQIKYRGNCGTVYTADQRKRSRSTLNTADQRIHSRSNIQSDAQGRYFRQARTYDQVQLPYLWHSITQQSDSLVLHSGTAFKRSANDVHLMGGASLGHPVCQP